MNSYMYKRLINKILSQYLKLVYKRFSKNLKIYYLLQNRDEVIVLLYVIILEEYLIIIFKSKLSVEFVFNLLYISYTRI